MRIGHIAMYVTDLEKAKDFFVHYFNAAANEGYHNKVTDLRSYFLSFEDGARLLEKAKNYEGMIPQF